MTNVLRLSPSGVAGAALTDRYGSPVDISVDAFGRLRTSDLTKVFDTKQIDLVAGTDVLMQNVEVLNGTAVYNSSRSSTVLTTTTVSGDRALRQSRRYLNYEAGKSQKFNVSFKINSWGGSGSRIRIGYYDDQNGIFYEYNGGNSFVLRSNVSGSPVDAAIPQASWNIDKLDGTGQSGLTFDYTKVQIFTSYFEWLGAGGVVLGFFIGNRFIPCHFISNSNVIDSVYMRTPNLPIRWEVVNTEAVAGSSQLEAICADVASEGGIDPFGLNRSEYLTSTVTTDNGSIRELVSLRLRCSGLTDSDPVATRNTVFPERYSVLNTSNDNGNVIVCLNPTFTGAGTWAAPNGASSSVQVSKTGRVITNVGTVLDSELFSPQIRSASAFTDRLIALSAAYDGTPDIITLGLVNTSGTSTTSLASFSWREL